MWCSPGAWILNFVATQISDSLPSPQLTNLLSLPEQLLLQHACVPSRDQTIEHPSSELALLRVHNVANVSWCQFPLKATKLTNGRRIARRLDKEWTKLQLACRVSGCVMLIKRLVVSTTLAAVPLSGLACKVRVQIESRKPENKMEIIVTRLACPPSGAPAERQH